MGRPQRAADGGLVYHVLNRANARMTVRRQLPFPFSGDCFSSVSSVGRAARETTKGLARTRELKPGSFSEKTTHLNPALDQEFRAPRFLLFFDFLAASRR